MKEGIGRVRVALPSVCLSGDWRKIQLIIHISCNMYMKSLKTQVGVRGVSRVALLPSVCLSGDWRKQGPYFLAPLFVVCCKRVSIYG